MSDTGRSNENEHPPSTPQLCMEIVHDYGQENYSKVAAVKSILAVFSESAEYEDTPQDQIDAAISTYIAMLDQHDSSQRLTAERGERSGINDEQEGYEREDRMGSTRRRSESPVTRNLSKKRTPDESLFAWLANDDMDRTALTPSQELTWKLVQNHAL